MLSLTSHAVGDGQFLHLNQNDHSIVNDFGSIQFIPSERIEKFISLEPFHFLLSHFHRDHYKGLLHCRKQKRKVNIPQVYFPRLPQFEQDTNGELRRNFMMASLSLSYYKLGDISGSREIDLIKVLLSINSSSFRVTPLSQGDRIYLGQEEIKIIWPPESVGNNLTRKVEEVLGDFFEAIEEDPRLRDIYEKIEDSEHLWELNEEPFYQEHSPVELNENESRITYLEDWVGEEVGIPEVSPQIRDLNKKVQSILDRISIGYSIDDKFLYLGDLFAGEINSALTYCEETLGLKEWAVIHLPHHGTRKSWMMEKIKGVVGISSIGPGLLKNWKQVNKKVCRYNYLTHINGNLQIEIDDGRISVTSFLESFE